MNIPYTTHDSNEKKAESSQEEHSLHDMENVQHSQDEHSPNDNSSNGVPKSQIDSRWTPRKHDEPMTPLAAYTATVEAYRKTTREYLEAARESAVKPVPSRTTLVTSRTNVESGGKLMDRASALLMGDRLRMRAQKHFKNVKPDRIIEGSSQATDLTS